MNALRRHLLCAAAGACALGPPRAFADDGRELRITLPIGPGNPLDAMARAIGVDLAQALHRPVIVVNRGGAAGQIAAAAVAKAAGDPNVLFLSSMGVMAVSPHLYPNLGYDTTRDFTPVLLCARSPNALIVNPREVPVRNVAEFVQWARQQKKPIPYGSYGSGSISHIAVEMLRSATGVAFVQVPYRDPTTAQTDLVKGDVPMIFDLPSAFLSFLKDDRVRMLAVTSKSRSPAFPEVPTMEQSGFRDFDLSNWYGFYLPKGVPPAAVEQLRAALKPIVDAPRLAERFLPLGFEPSSGGTESFAAFHQREYLRWQTFVRQHDIRLTT